MAAKAVQGNAIRHMRLFIIESPSAIDLLRKRTEAQVIESIAHLLGYDAATMSVKSRTEFILALKFITSIDEAHDDKRKAKCPLVVHIACHGGTDGLGIGPDTLTWQDLADALDRFGQRTEDYSGPFLLVISACHAREQTITEQLEKIARSKPDFRPPRYLFLTAGDKEGSVYWQKVVASWTVFYQQLSGIDLNDRDEIQTILDRIALADLERIHYYRWDDKQHRFRSYTAKNVQPHCHKGS
jgi:hypothetical protein